MLPITKKTLSSISVDILVSLLLLQPILCPAAEQLNQRRKILHKNQDQDHQQPLSLPQYNFSSYQQYPPLYPYSNGVSPTYGTFLRLYDVLPANLNSYDKYKQPNNNGTPTDVHFHVTILSIENINEELMTYEAEIFLVQKWNDPRLRVGTQKKEKDYQVLDVNWMEDFWRPDCFFRNAKSVKLHDMTVPNHFLWLYNDKTLMYMARLTLTLSCPMNFKKFPHDTQFCTMEMESLSQTTKDQVFKWDDLKPLIITDSNLELPQFNIVKSSAEDCTLVYSSGYGYFTCLKVVLEMRRKLGYHIFHSYIPSAFIVAFSWISFWIRPEATAVRITLCVASLLMLATQNVIQSLVIFPKVPFIKYIDVWMGFCTSFVIAAFLEFVLVHHFIGSRHQPENNSFKDIYELDTNADSQSQIQQFAGSADFAASLRKSNRKQNMSIKLDKISRFLFPIAFLIFNIVYWLIVLL
ncbi:unnamed protein product [Orchesella dallaii]|uniref:Uncharacterized protein n=1 Tax=Orchesella dallaii TaxID=48710 RepID=A0ABP1QEG6_9HEXA